MCCNILLLKTAAVGIDSVTASLDLASSGISNPAIYYLPNMFVQEQRKSVSLCGPTSEQLHSALVTAKHAIKAYRGSRGIAPLILNLVTGGRSEFNFTPGRFTLWKQSLVPI